MPRFSPQAKKIYTLIWYKADIEHSKALSKELTSSLDIAFAKLSFSFYFFAFQKPDLALRELKESEELNQSYPDHFISFIINLNYLYYYVGFYFIYPMISLELAKEYFSKVQSCYNQIEYLDDWEKYYCEGFYSFSKAVYCYSIEGNINQGIMFFKQSKESLRLIPEDGEFLSSVMSNLTLGLFQRFAGHFNESELNFQVALDVAEKYESFFQVTPLFNLAVLNIQKGEFEKALEFNKKHYELSKKFSFIPGIYVSLEVRGNIFYEEGNYDKALELYQEGLMYRKEYNDPLEIFMGYIDIFWFYYQNYKLAKDKEYFKKAEEIFFELKTLKEQYPDDTTITNYTNFSEARLLKYGNLNKRAKASIMFEELIKIWPNNFESVEEYLELLFEDYSISEDQETIEKIDLLMKKVIEIPLSYNSIDSFVSQQIMLARYQFFIKDDIESAFDILNEAKEKISSLKIDRFNSQLEKELMNFKNERTKWEKADYSVKERIKKSEFQKYIQEALSIKLG